MGGTRQQYNRAVRQIVTQHGKRRDLRNQKSSLDADMPGPPKQAFGGSLELTVGNEDTTVE